ncbi:MAG: flavodoxin domain-containing protein, partial [Shewanella sp.]
MLLKELSSVASPLSQGQVEKLKQFTSELTALQLAWVSGYLSAAANAGQVAPSGAAQSAPTLTILYGSQTGNGRGIAKALAAKAGSLGYGVNLASMGEYNLRQLKQESLLLVVVSTHGDGEAPDDAIELHQFLASKRAPRLAHLHYAVLGLGDTSYPFFCQTAKDFHGRLAALGAHALLPLVECDVDYEAAAGQWHADVLAAVKPLLASSSATVVPISREALMLESEFTKQNPYRAAVLVSQKITGRGSDNDVRHVEIDLGDSGLHYQAGDALGVWFTNSEALVEEILQGLDLAAETLVTLGNESLTLKQVLLEKKELTQLHPGLVTAWAELSGDGELLALSQDKEPLRQFILTHQFADLVARYPLGGASKAEANALDANA